MLKEKVNLVSHLSTNYRCFQYAKQIRETGALHRATITQNNVYNKVTYEKLNNCPDRITFSNKCDEMTLCGKITSVEFNPECDSVDRLKVSFEDCDSIFEIACYK